MATYKIGDLVQLKSGGPTMTVADDRGDGQLRCQWFAGKKLEFGWFPIESLKPGTAEE